MTDFDRRSADTRLDARTAEPTGTAAIADAPEQPEQPEQPQPEHTEGQAPTPLFGSDAIGDYRSRWDEVQTAFVDDPRSAVKGADGLVAEVMKDLARTFANERAGLEDQWSEGRDVSTEDLRVALQRYRSFFARLLTL
jgi:hypothetical protein